ncbi:hypothetical protein [Nocardia anaemiae]|uniref:hypothetical protein n=1 Tax=Nocardia anaemiae TaxID=263910 RepID=UPI0007A46388|nr:hypothetical protein [Nocardia anaemiae]
MSDSPSPKPNEPTGSPEPSGGARDEGSGEQFAAHPGQHESADPQPAEASAEHGRHEMAGPAGYPQFEGPGAAQYGSEPLEPPPPVGAPGQPGQPSYGPLGTGPASAHPATMPPGAMPPGAAATPAGAVPPGAMQPGSEQAGAAAPGLAKPGTVPPGSVPPGATQPGTMPPGTIPPPDAMSPGFDPGAPTYGYQSAPGAPITLDVGNALSYGWEKFRANFGPWLAVTAVGVIIYLAFVLIVQAVQPNSLFSLLLIFLAVMVAIWLLQAAMIRGALYETDGNKPTFASYFHFVNAGNVLLTALLAFALTWLGAALCFVPGLIAGFLCMFSLHFVVDQEQGPFEAIKSSATLVIANIGQVLLLALAVLVITFVATLLCGFGLLVAGPVCTIAVTYAYRALTGGTVSVT